MFEHRTWRQWATRAGLIFAGTAACYLLAALAFHLASLGHTPFACLLIILLTSGALAGGYMLGGDDMRDILTHIDEEQEEGGWL